MSKKKKRKTGNRKKIFEGNKKIYSENTHFTDVAGYVYV